MTRSVCNLDVDAALEQPLLPKNFSGLQSIAEYHMQRVRHTVDALLTRFSCLFNDPGLQSIAEYDMQRVRHTVEALLTTFFHFL